MMFASKCTAAKPAEDARTQTEISRDKLVCCIDPPFKVVTLLLVILFFFIAADMPSVAPIAALLGQLTWRRCVS
jgi:hypothetical protein